MIINGKRITRLVSEMIPKNGRHFDAESQFVYDNGEKHPGLLGLVEIKGINYYVLMHWSKENDFMPRYPSGANRPIIAVETKEPVEIVSSPPRPAWLSLTDVL